MKNKTCANEFGKVQTESTLIEPTMINAALYGCVSPNFA